VTICVSRQATRGGPLRKRSRSAESNRSKPATHDGRTLRRYRKRWKVARPFAPRVLEMDDDAGGELEVVLRLAEKLGAHVISFEAARKARIEAVIRAAARLNSK